MPADKKVALPDIEVARTLEAAFVRGRKKRLGAINRTSFVAAPKGESADPVQSDLERYFSKKDVLSKVYPKGDDVIICEGDSWFNHPFLEDIPEWLARYFGYSVLQSTFPGKLLSQSVGRNDFLAPFGDDRKPQIKALLLSGGGNDLISWKLNDQGVSAIFQQAGSRGKADDFVDHKALEAALGAMEKLLRVVPGKLAKVGAGKLPVLLHGYDLIHPHQYDPSPLKGTWINKQFDVLKADASIRDEIIAIVQRKWMERYQTVCSDLKWVFVDLEGCVAGSWYDEIHPHSGGFYRAAQRYVKLLDGLGIKRTNRVTRLAPF